MRELVRTWSVVFFAMAFDLSRWQRSVQRSLFAICLYLLSRFPMCLDTSRPYFTIGNLGLWLGWRVGQWLICIAGVLLRCRDENFHDLG